MAHRYHPDEGRELVRALEAPYVVNLGEEGHACQLADARHCHQVLKGLLEPLRPGQCPDRAQHLQPLASQRLVLPDEEVESLPSVGGARLRSLQPDDKAPVPAAARTGELLRYLYPEIPQMGLDAVLQPRLVLRDRVSQSYQRTCLQRLASGDVYPFQLSGAETPGEFGAVHRVRLPQLLAGRRRDIRWVDNNVVYPQPDEPVVYPEPAETSLVHGVILRLRVVPHQMRIQRVRIRTLAEPLQLRGLRHQCHRPALQMHIDSDVNVLSFEG